MPKDIHNTAEQSDFWSQRYQAQSTGWDIGYPSTPIKEYVDQLTDKNIKILIPGAGNAYEAEYIFQQGFTQLYVLDIAKEPLVAFAERNPAFPQEHLLHGNFFEQEGQYDLIIEQTFFCSFPPTADNRHNYAQKMYELLKPGGKLVGLWFDFPLTGDMEKRPFGGSKAEYLNYFEPLFEVITLERAHNSIPPRAGNELFGIFKKKE
jgi:thiopurine S-methyltransferase